MRSLSHGHSAQQGAKQSPNYMCNSHPSDRSSALIVQCCRATSLGIRLLDACPQSSGVPTLVFTHSDTLHQQELSPPEKCLQHHSTYLLACFVSFPLFPLASAKNRPSNCRKALDQIFRACRTALLQRSEIRRLEAFNCQWQPGRCLNQLKSCSKVLHEILGGAFEI